MWVLGNERPLMEARQIKYTMSDIAAAANMKADTVRKHSREGVFDSEDLLSVAWYITANRGMELAGKKESEEEG